jgi:hypothetical protein
LKYKLKLKGRTDKKNLTVNIGGEIKQYSKKECFDGIDVTDYLDQFGDPKFMAIEDKFVDTFLEKVDNPVQNVDNSAEKSTESANETAEEQN